MRSSMLEDGKFLRARADFLKWLHIFQLCRLQVIVSSLMQLMTDYSLDLSIYANLCNKYIDKTESLDSMKRVSVHGNMG